MSFRWANDVVCPHQSLGNDVVVGRAVKHGKRGRVSRRHRFGGLLNQHPLTQFADGSLGPWRSGDGGAS